MKMYNGNKRRVSKKPVAVAPSFNVIHQNLPHWKMIEQVGVDLHLILKRFHPAILFISEVDPARVEANTPDGYTFLRGTLKVKDIVRVCALIKVTESYEVLNLNLDVPTVAIKLLGWTFMGVYREWTHGADPTTNWIEDRGWTQFIQEITRSQKGQESGILDHVYCNQSDFVEHLFNENTTGTDHYSVGVIVRLTAPIFIAQTFFCRSIKKIPPGEFEQVFCNSRIYEVYRAADVNEALACLEFKVVRAHHGAGPEGGDQGSLRQVDDAGPTDQS